MRNIHTTSRNHRALLLLALLMLVFTLAGCAQSPLTVMQREDRFDSCGSDAGDSPVVADLGGKPYLTITGAWPQTAVRLPVGTYQVTARWNGKTATREVALDGKAGEEVYFHWKTEPQQGQDLGTEQ